MNYTTERQRDELMHEMAPIIEEMVAVAIDRLANLEARGYFAFGREAAQVVDRIVTEYSEEDVRKLGDNIVAILDTVRDLTQPNVLAVAGSATSAIQNADGSEAVGLYGMLKAGRDEDVRRGLGVMLRVLSNIGRAVAGLEPAPAAPPNRMQKRLAPRRAAPKRPAKAPVVCAAPAIPGSEYLEDWTETFATATAAELGIESLTEEHWTLIRYARSDYEANGASPNIRRLGTESGLGTRDVYRLFPRAPGRTIARIAGIPKPGGCI